jgi:anti-sigma factor RsiW
MEPSRCPVGLEEVVEAYVMGTLPKGKATAFEDHYITCTRCATVLEKTDEYVDAMRAAAKELQSKPLLVASRKAAS